MKNISITIATLLVGVTLFGQKLKLTEAAVAYKDLSPLWMMQQDELEASKATLKKAKSAIDESFTQQEESKSLKTKDVAKLNYYRGVIYLDYTMLAGFDETILAEIEANQKTFETVPFEALKKSLATSNYYEEDITNKINMLRGMAIQGGVAMFEEGKLKEAFAAFAGAVEMSDVVGYKDTLAMFNAGLAADKIDDYDNAIKYYAMAAEADYLHNADVYRNIIQVVNRKNDGSSDEAYTYIEKAKAKYPGDINIIIEEFNYFNSKGDAEKAQASLQTAIEKDPNNPVFHYSIGATFDDLANKRHEAGMHDEAQVFVEKAVESYSKAIELNPDYADAYYNMGVLFNNEAYEKDKQVQSIEDMVLYEQEKGKSKELLKKAIPFLVKSHEMSPKDTNTLKLLKSIYFSLEMEDKYAEVDAKLKELGG